MCWNHNQLISYSKHRLIVESAFMWRGKGYSSSGPLIQSSRFVALWWFLNDEWCLLCRFVELSSLLEPGRPPKNDKLAILGDAIRVVNQLRAESQEFKETNEKLAEEIKSLKVGYVYPAFLFSQASLIFGMYSGAWYALPVIRTCLCLCDMSDACLKCVSVWNLYMTFTDVSILHSRWYYFWSCYHFNFASLIINIDNSIS